ncbi:MAG: hypothetical protein ABFC38_11950 [Methanospirillum sp.]
MNRTFLLIAIAAVTIAGIGVGLLLPGLQGGPLTGSIVPITTLPPLTMTKMPTPTPVPPVSITIMGTCSPYRFWDNTNKLYDWNWNLHSVTTYDATCLPPGVLLQRVDWTITGTRNGGGTRECVHQYSERWAGMPDYGIPPTELPVTDTYAIDDGYTWVGCPYYGPDICPPEDRSTGTPFTASCTITTTDGNSYTKTVPLVLST